MLKIFPIFILSLLLSSCANELTDNALQRDGSQIIHVCIDNVPPTRVSVDGVKTKWSIADQLQVFEINPSGDISSCMTYRIVDNSISEDGKSADFTGAQMQNGYKYIAYYGEGIALNEGRIVLTSSNISQQGSSLSHIDRTIYLASEILLYDGQAALFFQFKHLSTIMEFNLELSAEVVDKCQIAQIDIFAPGKPFSDKFEISSEGKVLMVDAERMSNIQTLQITQSPELSTSTSFKAQVACIWNPSVTSVTNEFIIVVRTTDGKEATIRRAAKVLQPGIIYYINEKIFPVNPIELDREALIAFYNATNGESWSHKTNWCSNEPINKWQGVSTHPTTGRVVGISLNTNNLSGNIPPEIGFLSELTALSLSDNKLDGVIPAELGKLVRLSHLELSNNNLTGALPVELSKIDQIGDLPNSFNLSRNRLTGRVPDACLAYKYFAGWIITPQQDGYGFTDDTALKLDINRKEISAAWASFSVQLSSSRSWSANTLPSWITLSPSFGDGNQTINVSCLANTTDSERTATIIFTAGIYTSVLTVVQSGLNAAISLDLTSKEITATANSFNVNITSNTNWVTNSLPSWITLSPSSSAGSRSASVSCSANTTAIARQATIIFTAGGSSTSLYVRQLGAIPTISLDRTSWNVEGIQGSFSIYVETNGATWSVSGVPEWLSLSPNTGIGNQEVIATHQVNPIYKDRYATLVFTAGEASVKYTIRQGAGKATISLDKPTITINGAQSSFDLTVTTNDSPWTTSNIPDWVQLSDYGFKTSKTITISCNENTSSEKRVATITFTASWSAQTTLTITQTGGSATIELSQTRYHIDKGAGSFEIAVTTNNASWSAVSDAAWLTVSPDNSTGSEAVELFYTANTVAVKRIAKVLFTAGNTSKELVVTQSAASGTITIDKQSWEIGSSAESTEVNITTNQAPWSMSNLPDWLSASPTTGTGSGKVVISCLENKSGEQRTESIQFEIPGSSGANGSFQILQITQQGQAIVEVGVSGLKFKGEATSQNFSLTSNTSWTTTKDQDWITVSPSSGSATTYGAVNLTVTVDANTSNANRNGVITITAGTGASQVVKTVNITQGFTPTISVASQSFSAPFWASSYNIALESNTLWTATSDQSWCSLSPTSGNGNGSLAISVSKNTSNQPRTAIITLTAGTKAQGLVTRTITIKQNPNNDFSIGDWTDNGDHGGDAE